MRLQGRQWFTSSLQKLYSWRSARLRTFLVGQPKVASRTPQREQLWQHSLQHSVHHSTEACKALQSRHHPFWLASTSMAIMFAIPQSIMIAMSKSLKPCLAHEHPVQPSRHSQTALQQVQLVVVMPDTHVDFKLLMLAARHPWCKAESQFVQSESPANPSWHQAPALATSIR